MAFTITYHTLFEVQLRHGYWLNPGDRKTDFALDNNPNYDIRSIFKIVPTPATQRWLAGHKAKLVTTANSIKVVMKSESTSTGFKPFIPTTTSDRLQFSIVPKIATWSNFTNMPLQASMPANFYFSNTTPNGTTAYPYISRPLGAYNNQRAYEMGSLLQLGNRVMVAQRAVVTNQAPVNGGNVSWWPWLEESAQQPTTIVSAEDQLLLPKTFNYTFRPLTADQAIQEGSAVLKQLDDSVVQTINFTETESIRQLSLDFSEQDSGFYLLEVSSNNGYEHNQLVYLHDELYNTNQYALLDIGITNAGDFRILEGDDRLRVNNDNDLDPPVFQLLIPNRLTWWQYRLRQASPPVLANSADVTLQNSGAETTWLTKQPKPLSWSTTAISIKADSDLNDDISDAVLLPNPTTASLYEDEEGRYCSSIFLSSIKL